jgi:hypothetical protein
LILLAGVGAFVLLLHRGEVGGPLLLGLGMILAASRVRHSILWFAVAGMFVWSLGATANYLISLYFDVGMMKVTGLEEFTVWRLIEGGAPDVREGLLFFQQFLRHGSYTFGRTWLGGLIPLQSQWHPGLFALRTALELSPEEANNFPGGGLRLAIPIQGYACLGWPGVLIFSLTMGVLTGYIVRFARRRITGSAPTEIKALVVMVAWVLIGSLDAPNWHVLTPLIMLLPVIYPVRFPLGSALRDQRATLAAIASNRAKTLVVSTEIEGTT